jgi:hypothetical protein
MALSALVLGVFFNFYKSFNESSDTFNQMQDEFKIVNNWLTFLQKIIFEKGKYISVKDGDLSFVSIENGVEKTYILNLENCNNNTGKTLYYYNSDTKVNLFNNQCLTWVQTIEYSFPNLEIKEKITRVRIKSVNVNYDTTLFINN